MRLRSDGTRMKFGLAKPRRRGGGSPRPTVIGPSWPVLRLSTPERLAVASTEQSCWKPRRRACPLIGDVEIATDERTKRWPTR